MGISNREKGMLRHARKVKSWYDRNRWVRIPVISLLILLTWYTPYLAIFIGVSLGLYFTILWNIISKS